MRKFYPRKLGMCACGKSGYKIDHGLSVCYRCYKLEQITKFPELHCQTKVDAMAEKIKAEIQEYRNKSFMYLE